tara:strand:+ start:471 stop:626 length:156 start_codon:yes stop_codon:yes gene_type:complete
MVTELTEITKYIRIYNNPSNEKAYNEACEYLLQVHRKWGTCDVSLIKNLLK